VPESPFVQDGVSTSVVQEPASAKTDIVGSSVLALLMSAVFMVSAEARLIAPLLPAIASDLHSTIAQAGLLLTAYSLPYGIFQLVYGPLADRFSRQRVMGFALSFFAVGTLVSGFAPSQSILTSLRFATGAAAAGVIPIALAFVGDTVPYGQRQAALGRVVSVAALGGIMSAAIGGTAASFVSWRVIFVSYGVIALIVAGALLRFAPSQTERVAQPRPKGVLGPYRAVFDKAGARAVALYTLVFIEGMTVTSTQGYLGALLFERDGLSYATIGLLLTLNGVASLLTARLVGRLVTRLTERGMLLIGGTLLMVSYLLVNLQPTFVFFSLAMLLSGAGFVIGHSTLQTRATELVPSQRGTAVSLFAFSLFVGGGVGTWLAGLSIDAVGFPLTIIGTAVSIAIFTALSWPLLTIGQRPGHHRDGINDIH
jgi:predicted MFS family arabinose efflux permease